MPALSEMTGPSPRPQREAAAWRGSIEDVANLNLVRDIGPGRAVGIALDADMRSGALGSPDSE